MGIVAVERNYKSFNYRAVCALENTQAYRVNCNDILFAVVPLNCENLSDDEVAKMLQATAKLEDKSFNRIH